MKIFLTTLFTVLFLFIGCSNEEENTLKLVSLPESCEEIKYLYENKFRPKLILQEICKTFKKILCLRAKFTEHSGAMEAHGLVLLAQ